LADFELIVSDNCSEDNSWEVISAYAVKYPKIRAVRTSSNIGMAGNINHAASYATGKYLAILHHDDILDRMLLESWVDVADRTGATFVFNEYLVDGLERHKLENRGFAEKMPGRGFLFGHLLKGWGSPVRGTALVRHDKFDAVGGADLRFGMLADVDLWMKLAAVGDVGYVHKPLITVFHHRPPNYPPEYSRFSWPRKVLLFAIHANNIRQGYFSGVLDYLVFWTSFRCRVSLEVIRWLAYGFLKRKWEIVSTSGDSRNPYEFWVVRGVRKVAQVIYPLFANTKMSHGC
jgi:GT2 family glycosyltransferase